MKALLTNSNMLFAFAIPLNQRNNAPLLKTLRILQLFMNYKKTVKHTIFVCFISLLHSLHIVKMFPNCRVLNITFALNNKLCKNH